jgi:ectoine hydroxylase-related dioxygenase (phytanoyl-CoA dioxygenase family)
MITDDEKTRFQKKGYVVIGNVLPSDQLQYLRRVALDLARQEPTRSAWNELICLKRRAFQQLLTTDRAIRILESLVGSETQLLRFDLRIARPRSTSVEWHRDDDMVCNKTRYVTAAIYLQNTHSALGALRVAPGSHTWGNLSPVTNIREMTHEIRCIEVEAGSVIFHDARLWHTASDNQSSLECWAIFMMFGERRLVAESGPASSCLERS